MSDDGLTEQQIRADGIAWENYTAAFNINANSKKIVYAKATDEAGNTAIVNSDGVVIYTDSVQADASITYTRLSKEDQSFTVTQGIGGNDTNDAPKTTTVNLKVEKITGTVSVIGDPGKTYDGMPVSLNFDRNNNAGDVVIEFKAQGSDDTAYNTTVPKNVGNYTVRVTVKADSAGNYTEAVATKDFSITPKGVTINGTTVEAAREYDGTIIATITGDGALTGKCGSDDLSFIPGTASYSDKNVGTDKTVTFDRFTLTGDARDNYTLNQPRSVTADITSKELTVDVAVKDKQYDGLNTASFADTPALIGVVDGDIVSLTNGTPAFATVEAEENIPVNFTNFFIIGTDAGNYNLNQPFGVTADIYNNYTAAKGTDYTVNSNDWLNTDFEVMAKNGYELSETNTADGTWKDTLTATEETASGSLTFYVRNKQTGAISNPVAENYKLDTTAPVILGVENGKTYCEAQTVTVDEKYIDSVTVNGTPVILTNKQFTLPAESTQTIVVTDKAGNVSDEMIVTVNDGHTYEWQSENGQYWKKCKFCGDETAKKDIPKAS